MDFMQNKGNLLCSEASLPGTSLATAEVKDNFMGIPQEFAHTRLYTDIDFTFLIDYDYTILKNSLKDGLTISLVEVKSGI